MWIFIARRLRVFLVVALLLPLIATVARRLAERLEREGPTTGSRGLHVIEGTARGARSFLR